MDRTHYGKHKDETETDEIETGFRHKMINFMLVKIFCFAIVLGKTIC